MKNLEQGFGELIKKLEDKKYEITMNFES